MKQIKIGTATLIHGDCEEFMKDLPDKCFDLAVVDPPYGIGIDGQKENIKYKKSDRKKHIKKGWDNKIPGKSYFVELEKKSFDQIIWGGNYFVEHLNNGTKGWIIWDKDQHGLTMSDCELAYSTYQKPTRIWKCNRCILKSEGTIHPTQKPVKLYEWILKNYAKPGQTILDTHGGSMSSVIAALNMGFEITCIEKDEDYFNAAVERVIKSQQQQKLF